MKKIIILLSLSFIFTQNPISIDPESINFGLIASGETASSEVTVSNSSDELLAVEIESNSGYIYSLYPSINVPANGSTSLTINYTPSSSGVVNAIISFNSTYDESDYITSLSCTGSSFSLFTGGEVSGNWDIEMSPIIIEDDIVVPEGESLIIDAGVELYFHALTSLTVEGTLIAIGSYEEQIIFQSLNEGDYWNGLNYLNSSGNTLEYVSIQDVYGDFYSTRNLNHEEYWNCDSAIEFSGGTFSNPNNGGNNCSLKYPIFNSGDSTLIHFNTSVSNYSSGNGCVYVYIGSWSYTDCQAGGNGSVYLSDISEPGEFVEVSFALHSASYGTESLSGPYVDKEAINGGVALLDSDLEISNSLFIDNKTAINATNSNLSILNTNLLDNTDATITQSFSVIDLRNSIIYGSPERGEILSINDGVLLTSYSMVDEFPFFLDDQYHLDSNLSPAIDAGDPQQLDECIPPGLGGVRSDIGMYGGINNCGSLPTNIPDGKPIIDNIVDINKFGISCDFVRCPIELHHVFKYIFCVS